MADLTLPGTISGLLRRGSPVIFADSPGIIAHVRDGFADVAMNHRVIEPLLSEIALDLCDPTGLIHAFWWLVALPDKMVSDTLRTLGLDRPEFGDLLSRVFTGADLTDAERAEFRRVCLQVAGVSDAG